MSPCRAVPLTQVKANVKLQSEMLQLFIHKHKAASTSCSPRLHGIALPRHGTYLWAQINSLLDTPWDTYAAQAVNINVLNIVRHVSGIYLSFFKSCRAIIATYGQHTKLI